MLALCLALAAGSVWADVRVSVTDQHGRPVADALVHAPGSMRPAADATSRSATIGQRDLEFEPRFSAVGTGTTVHFPNFDRSRHHVYSFSPAKVFELKLYRGETAEPVTFDAPGIVTLGCNVHDWMVAWIYVVDSARWQLTDASGSATLDVADGEPLEVWHPFLRAPVAVEAGTRSVRITLREDIVIPERPDDTETASTRRRPRARQVP